MIKTIILFSIFATIVFIVGCNRCDKKNEHYNIAPADKFVYQISDKLVYKNNFGGRDTFEVTEKSSYIGYYPFDGKCSDVGIYVEYFFCSFQDTSSNNSFIYFTTNYINCTWLESGFDSRNSSGFTILPEYQLNGNIYKNVYFFINDTIIVPSISALVAYISRSHGVLSITKRNGTIWEFEKVISQSKSI